MQHICSGCNIFSAAHADLCIIMAFAVSTRTERSSIVISSKTNIAIADRLILLSKLCVFAFWGSVEGWTAIGAKDAHNMLNGNPESIISLVHLIGDDPSHRAREHKCLIFCCKYWALVEGFRGYMSGGWCGLKRMPRAVRTPMPRCHVPLPRRCHATY